MDDLEGFWASIWRYFDIQATPYDAVLRRPRDARSALVRGRAAELRRARAARRRGATRVGGDRGRRGRASAASCAGTSCALAVGGVAARRCASAASAPATWWPATCPTAPRRSSPIWPAPSIGAIWSSCAPDLAARRRAGSLRPAAPGGADRLRRLPLRRPRPRPARGRGRARRRADDPGIRGGHGERLGRGGPPALRAVGGPGGVAGAARLRAAPLRPPALRALLVGDHRAAQGHRPRPRRPAARPHPPPRAALDLGPADRFSFYTDDELDGLELARRRPAGRARRSCSTTAARAIPSSTRSSRWWRAPGPRCTARAPAI